MSVTVVGSVALDTVETPYGKEVDVLGGAAVYFALAAANYTTVHLVGIVGEDFPPANIELLERKGVDLGGLERAPGKTFRWAGRYHEDVNLRDTLDTQLNVFEEFHPKLPRSARKAEFLFLGNIHPALQLEVLEQTQARFTALDTMNLWIDAARQELETVLARVDAVIINDNETKQLTGEKNVIKGAARVAELGPKTVVVKKGEHGCLLFHEDRMFAAAALPLAEIQDPTGAGDSFAGGFMGYLAREEKTDFAALRRAVIQGTVVASFTCEAFGPAKLLQIDPETIEERIEILRELSAF